MVLPWSVHQLEELSDSLYAEVERLSSEGNDLADAGNFEQALSRFQTALQVLPEPPVRWSAGLWLLVSIGDMLFQLGRYPEGREALMTAMKFYAEAPANPFIRLRLGQCMFELGENGEAANWLAGAFISEGMRLFSDEDPKYVRFVKSHLQPPPGGWPKGW